MPVEAAPGWGQFGSCYSEAQGVVKPPIPPWEGPPTVSPALANSRSLHLDCEELPGATLEYSVTSTL